MIPFLKVLYTDPDWNEFDISKYVLNLQISKGSEATKNSVTIELQNHNGELTSGGANDLGLEINNSSVLVYLDWKEITSQEPIISATISGIEYLQDEKYKIRIKATDKTGLLLSKLWAYAYTESADMNVSDIIINVVDHLNDLDGEVIINDLTTNHVATTKRDGSAFPKPVTISKIWKPGYEWLNELSGTEYTGEDRPYVYYVDANNDLHWEYPEQKPTTTLTSNVSMVDTTINVTSTVGYPPASSILIDDEIITYTGKTDTSFTGCSRGTNYTTASAHTSGAVVSGLYLEVGKNGILSLNIPTTDDSTYNFIIYKGGMTPDGYDYLDYTLNEMEIGKKFRMKFFDWSNVGNDMTSREKARSEWGADKNSSYPNSYPYTPLWTSTAVTTDEEYQDSFVLEVIKRCKTKAESYFITGKQKYTANAQLIGTTQYEVNDLVNCVSPKFGINMLLRVKEIKHQVNQTGWITDLELTSDQRETE